eukprot:Nk52_evm81s914 gene=Nk52_evmTU81s914
MSATKGVRSTRAMKSCVKKLNPKVVSSTLKLEGKAASLKQSRKGSEESHEKGWDMDGLVACDKLVDGVMRKVQCCSWGPTQMPTLTTNWHDQEWCVPSYDDKYIFEMIALGVQQCGLSWRCILSKREYYRRAFDDYQDIKKIADYTEDKINEIMQMENIIRNRRKIEAVVTNAQVAVDICKEFNSLSDYIWRFNPDSKPLINDIRSREDSRATSPESQEMSKDLRKRGMKFMGPIICYSFMQGIGMVCDHHNGCYRKQQPS